MRKKSAGPGSKDERSLTKRYLFWLYKTTKDELDRIDRKFTQLDIDRSLQAIFKKEGEGLDAFVGEWENYIAAKEAEAKKLKWDPSGALAKPYVFLRLKMDAILRVTRRRCGARAVEDFKRMYEEAAFRNIMSDASSKR